MIHTEIKAQMVEAMKAKDAVRLDVLRGLLSAFTNENVAKKRRPDEEISDEEALAVLSRQAKQRKDSIEQFVKGGRAELAEDEKRELVIIESYLPQQMSKEEVENFVKSKVEDINPTIETKNQFMGMIMKELKGKADGAIVREVVENLIK